MHIYISLVSFLLLKNIFFNLILFVGGQGLGQLYNNFVQIRTASIFDLKRVFDNTSDFKSILLSKTQRRIQQLWKAFHNKN